MRDSCWVIPAAMLLVVQHCSAWLISYSIDFHGRPPTFDYMLMALVLSAFGGLLVFLYRLFRMFREREPRPLKRLRAEADGAAILTYVIGFQLVGLQMAALTWLKEMLPLANPFWADPLLASIERSLLTVDAWRLVPQSFVGPLDAMYPLWAPIKFAALLLMLCLPSSSLKARALLAYFLTVGLLGVSGQYLFSSVGPIFYDRLIGGNDFALLTKRVDEYAPVANLASAYLWDAYTAGKTTIGGGISAMPSIHVATTAWMALALSAAWPRLRLALWAMWLIILIGSFALGWHYLLDGLAGSLGALACWHICGMYLNPRQETARFQFGRAKKT